MLKFQSCILWLLSFLLFCHGHKFSLFKKSPNAQEGDLRLVGSSRKSEGRVEIYHDGQWGTVCDDGWDLTEAQVVCRQLKFRGAKAVVTEEEIYGQASGPIWMDDTECSGTEKHLHACQFRGWGVGDCTHKEDVGVICETGPERNLLDVSNILDHRGVLSENMGDLYDKGTFCDLSITAQSSSPDDQNGTLQAANTISICAHKVMLSQVDAFNITDDTKNITVQVVQRCVPYFSSFIRYLYTRKIEVTFSSVQCLHWLSSKFGVEQLRRDSSLLFNQVLPEDGSFKTPVSVHEYAVETKDFVLQEICVQFMAWNFLNFSQTPAWTHISEELLSSLLVRSDLVVPDELFVLKAVENWILNNVNTNMDTRTKLLSLVRFPMLPAELLTPTYMLANSPLYTTHKAVFDENMLKALQFNVLLFSSLQSKKKVSVEDDCYQPRIYTAALWSISFAPFSHPDTQSKFIYAKFHSSLIFQAIETGWTAELNYQCSDQGMGCLPMATLSQFQSNSQPGVVFHNRLLLMCEDRHIGEVMKFNNNVINLAKNTSRSMTYPCRNDIYSTIFVVRPELI